MLQLIHKWNKTEIDQFKNSEHSHGHCFLANLCRMFESELKWEPAASHQGLHQDQYKLLHFAEIQTSC